MNTPPFLFCFDVESIGLHGPSFAVAWCVADNSGLIVGEKILATDRPEKGCDEQDIAWCAENIPKLTVTCDTQAAMMDEFWNEWLKWKEKGAVMIADCAWPVEARFLIHCIENAFTMRKWEGPYPLHDLASIRLALGQDPTGTFDRFENEIPAHNPLNDARQTARHAAELIFCVNQPLRSQTEGNRLVVSIGLETLAWASSAENGGPLDNCKVDPAKHHEFSKDVCSEIMRDDEIGNMPISDFLDEMIQKAADRGSEAIDWKE